MSYEERIFDGATYWRTNPSSPFQIKKRPIDLLLQTIKRQKGFRFNKEVLYFIGMHASTVSKIRRGVAKLEDAQILRIHEQVGMSVTEIRRLSETPRMLKEPRK